MKRTTYQVPELRDENDNIIQQGAFGKNTALANSTNDGWIDYVANDLEALRDNINGSRIYVANKAALPATGDLSAMYIAEDTGKWYLWDGTKYIETDNARKIADEAIAARDAAKASANDAANSAREQQSDWNVTDTTSKAFIKNKPDVKISGSQNVSASLVINPTVGQYNENIRMNQSSSGWATIYLGASLNTMSGPEEHAWGIFRDPNYALGIWPNDSSNRGKKGLYLPLNGRATLDGKTVILDGDTVGKATADAAGNNIQTTYAKKSDLSSSVSTTSLTVSGETSVPTANAGNSSKAIANTEFVQGELTNYFPLSGGNITGDLSVTGTITGNVTGNVTGNADTATNAGAAEKATKDGDGNIITVTYLPILNNAGAHNSIYRGKYLGDHVTDEQYDAIDAGTFEGLFIGDYWVINDVNWRIAAFDYWLHCGDTECTTHHVVIVPDTNLATCRMNNSSATTGAYIGSNYYTGANSNTGKATANTAINNAFGSSHILTHREHLQNAVTNGYESGGTWYDSKFELMTERMVYGCDIFHNTMNGTNVPNWYSIDKSQLPLFALEPSRITNRATWWLRDVMSATAFANVAHNGNANNNGASASLGVRPAFAIKK